MEDKERVWERLDKESEQAYEAFQMYKDMGLQRSLTKVAKTLNKSIALMGRWSTRDGWKERALAYDRYIEKVATDTQTKTIQDMLERHTKMSLMFQNAVVEGLRELKGSKLSATDLIRIFETSVRIERQSRGVADVVDEVRLQQAQVKLEIEKTKADLEGKSLEESSGFLEGLEKSSQNVWENVDKPHNPNV